MSVSLKHCQEEKYLYFIKRGDALTIWAKTRENKKKMVACDDTNQNITLVLTGYVLK